MKRLFLSWCHRDRRAKDALVTPLMDELSILRGVDVAWWEDSHIRIGEDWRRTILARLDECDYGLLLLSPGFFASPFITEDELPHLLAVKGVLPVGLQRVAFDGTRVLHGVEQRQVFTLQPEGKFFSETRGPVRERFVRDLATAIRTRVLDDEA